MPASVVALALAESDTCAVLAEGRLKCWGAAAYGQLGLGDSEARGDQPGEMGDALPDVNLGTGLRVRAVAAGRWYTCALFDDARVKCWGYEATFALGEGTVALGDAPNQMGDALPFLPLDASDEPISLSVASERGCAVQRSGKIRCWGATSGAAAGTSTVFDFGQGQAVRALSLSIKDDHSCALLEAGQVRCWGSNTFGQLGVGNTVAVQTPSATIPVVDLGTNAHAIAVSSGMFHSCALLEGGTVKCWGDNRYGQLGQGDLLARGDWPGTMGDALPSVQLGTGRHAVAIGAGGSSSCALLDDGSVKCWGGERVQRGLGDAVHGDGPFEMGDQLPAIDFGSGRHVTLLGVGEAHACAVLDNGELKCFGLNSSGELGLGHIDEVGDDAAEMGDALPAVDLGSALM
jgi:alpha-tubulin suppressor-like RCC1 family protein